MGLIVGMSFLYKCDCSLCLPQILIFKNLYQWLISPVCRVWLLSGCFNSLIACVFKFYKIDNDVSGCTFLYYSCSKLTTFLHVVRLPSLGRYKQMFNSLRPPNKWKYHSARVQLGEPMSLLGFLIEHGQGVPYRNVDDLKASMLRKPHPSVDSAFP